MKLTLNKKSVPKDEFLPYNPMLVFAKIMASISAVFVSILIGAVISVASNAVSKDGFGGIMSVFAMATGVLSFLFFGAFIWGRRSRTRNILVLSLGGAAVFLGIVVIAVAAFAVFLSIVMAHM